MYKNDTYNETMLFVIDWPATQDDIDAHPGEHATYLAAIAPTEQASEEALPTDTAVSE